MWCRFIGILGLCLAAFLPLLWTYEILPEGIHGNGTVTIVTECYSDAIQVFSPIYGECVAVLFQPHSCSFMG